MRGFQRRTAPNRSSANTEPSGPDAMSTAPIVCAWHRVALHSSSWLLGVTAHKTPAENAIFFACSATPSENDVSSANERVTAAYL